VTVISTAGYAPNFVRDALHNPAALAADATITATGQVLSALRRAANGDPVAVLLDQEQADALASLPFAANLATFGPSAPVPVALIVVVDGRIPQARAQQLSQALLHLAATPQGAATLNRLKLNGFAAPRLPAPGP
jgi:hypothetical protein